jgi:hypothetical protein
MAGAALGGGRPGRTQAATQGLPTDLKEDYIKQHAVPLG